MPVSCKRALRRLLSDASGFTLIELLVAAVTGVVVVGAAMGILVVSQHQTAILRDVGEATRSGRTTMTHVIDELHSSCIAKEFAPVLKESTPSKLIFVNAYSKEAEIKTGTKTREDIVTFNKETGTLTDEALASTGGEWPSFTFQAPGTGTKVTVGTQITETASSPVFTYYQYKEAPELDGGTGAASTNLRAIEKEKIPLKGFSETEAKTIAGVGINFTAAPAGGLETVGRSASFNTLVTLAFSSPNTEAEPKDGPCR
jgi:type II secretory pathway pseudopilin PulG